ncbi:Lipoprotein LprN [Frankliniella fusca]|uniref:Lipoprotein LprN n=1 Tax=Frankliniella fusca TaxID=407009 RepID=A0AAE1GZC5_9NEOP|nr:Lipoprotein LprN [Frankliniella fusca]
MKCMTCKLTIGEMYPIKAAIHEVRRFDGKSVDSVKIDISKNVLKELLHEVEETNKLVCRKRPASDLTDGEASTSAFPIKVVKIE